ncbi:helix-turn-helix domain-containing protein, partial [Thalassotalea fusca]
MTQLTSDALLKLSKREKNPHKRVRLLAVSLFLECQNRTQDARQLKVARRSVNSWVTRFLSEGLNGLEDKPRLGKKSSLSDKQKIQLTRFIAHHAKS